MADHCTFVILCNCLLSNLIYSPCRIRHFWFHIETVVLPPEKELSVAVLNLCNTFKAQYLQDCKRDIVRDKR